MSYSHITDAPKPPLDCILTIFGIVLSTATVQRDRHRASFPRLKSIKRYVEGGACIRFTTPCTDYQQIRTVSFFIVHEE